MIFWYLTEICHSNLQSNLPENNSRKGLITSWISPVCSVKAEVLIIIHSLQKIAYFCQLLFCQGKFLLASETTEYYVQDIVQLMQKLVRVVLKLKADVKKIKWSNLHEEMSEDWKLFDDRVFSVRFSLFLS